MRRILYCLVIISATQVSFAMSTALPTPCQECPVVTVDCPTQFVDTDVPVRFSADVIGAHTTAKITYNWAVSAGTIIGGQGTFSIIVDQSGTGGQSMTATVEVGGFDPICQTTASCSFVLCPAPLSRKFDEYGNTAFKDEKAHLNKFGKQLQNEPESRGYIITYGRRRGRAGEAQAHAHHARSYLVKTYAINPERIVTVDGGFRTNLEVELWLMPTGAQPPKPTPTVSPDEVKTGKDTVKRN